AVPHPRHGGRAVHRPRPGPGPATVQGPRSVGPPAYPTRPGIRGLALTRHAIGGHGQTPTRPADDRPRVPLRGRGRGPGAGQTPGGVAVGPRTLGGVGWVAAGALAAAGCNSPDGGSSVDSIKSAASSLVGAVTGTEPIALSEPDPAAADVAKVRSVAV